MEHEKPGASRRPADRRGAAALELALILPLLVTLVLACVDFGRFASTYIGVTNGARSGAGVASFNPVTASTQSIWNAAIRQAVVDEMEQIPAFDPALLTVPSAQLVVEADGLKRVRVEASYPFEMIVSWPFLPNSLTLTRAVEMRVIR